MDTSAAPNRSFLINTTEFGINIEKSSFDVSRDGTELSVNLWGNDATYAALPRSEGDEWSWTLYPPRFYAEFPISAREPDGCLVMKINRDQLDEYEAALYLMEHHDVDEVTVRLLPGQWVEVTGKAFLFEEVSSFTVKWKK